MTKIWTPRWNLTRLKPYGDTMNDGKVQLSFTLPVKDDDKGAAAAVLMAQKMGLADPNVALRQKLDEAFTFYVVYGSLTHSINYNEIVVQTVADEAMGMDETDEFLKERLGASWWWWAPPPAPTPIPWASTPS